MSNLNVSSGTNIITEDIFYENIYVSGTGILDVQAFVVTTHASICCDSTHSHLMVTDSGVLEIGDYFCLTPTSCMAFSEILETKKSRLVRQQTMVNKEILQNLGLKNKLFTINGFVICSFAAIRTELMNSVGTVGFIYQDKVLPLTKVTFIRLSLGQNASRPMEFKFSMDMVEVKMNVSRIYSTSNVFENTSGQIENGGKGTENASGYILNAEEGYSDSWGHILNNEQGYSNSWGGVTE